MKNILALCLFAALVCIGQAKAQQAISYTYAELGYLESEIDRSGIDEDGDGYEFNLSAGVAESLALVFGYQDVEFDRDIEAKLISLGIAYHKPYSNTGDMVFSLSYLDTEVDAPGIDSIEEDGNEISLEVRSRSSAQTEVHLGYLRREIDDESESGYLFRIISGNPQGFKFVIDYEDLDDTSGLMLGLRSSF